MPEPRHQRRPSHASQRTRSTLVTHDRAIEDLRLTRAGFIAERDAARSRPAASTASPSSTERIERTDRDLTSGRDVRDSLVGEIADLSDRLVTRFDPEALVATLDGRRPVVMLPARIETRFEAQTKLRVRVFPDQLHLDAHDPALTADEIEGAKWYWRRALAGRARRPGRGPGHVDGADRRVPTRAGRLPRQGDDADQRARCR